MFVVGGESLIDLVSAPRAADNSIHMVAHQGGSPFNCAIALSKLGNDTGFLCPISKDGFGSYLLEPLEAAGVKQLLASRVTEPTTLAVVTLDQAGKAQYEFYRGADRALDALGARVEPIYRTLPGWGTSLSAAREPADLPAAARDLIDLIEREAGVPVGVVGVGAERDDHLVEQARGPLDDLEVAVVEGVEGTGEQDRAHRAATSGAPGRREGSDLCTTVTSVPP